MLENRYYAISIFSNEWWINNFITITFIILLLLISKKIKNKGYLKEFNYAIGILLFIRLFWNQWYQYSLGQWDMQWSLPIQMCSFTSILSGFLLIIHNFKITYN